MEDTQIYKSEERGAIESEIFCRYSTFNFDEYNNESHLPFGALKVLNDEILHAGNSIVRHAEEYMDVIVIPLSGAIAYKDSLANKAIIETEQAGIFSVQEGMAYELSNLYEKSDVSYLQLWIGADSKNFNRQVRHKDFTFAERNTHFPVFSGKQSCFSGLKTNSNSFGSIGIYDKKKKGTYALMNPENGLFAFVINGAFEFEDRLIQSRDGISFRNLNRASFESLSDNGAILLIEVPLK